jgi:hypothetical protein
MKRFFVPLLLSAGALAACNASLVEEQAPQLVSTAWVLPAAAAKPDLDERWRVYAFFLPT